jgi:hypothetical protein
VNSNERWRLVFLGDCSISAICSGIRCSIALAIALVIVHRHCGRHGPPSSHTTGDFYCGICSIFVICGGIRCSIAIAIAHVIVIVRPHHGAPEPTLVHTPPELSIESLASSLSAPLSRGPRERNAQTHVSSQHFYRESRLFFFYCPSQVDGGNLKKE